ncbi:hypothetical protein ACFL6N_01290 [Thermodesulfobacteriota bacterium]
MPEPVKVTIYTTPQYTEIFDLDSLELEIVSLPLQEMVKLFLEQGRYSDICILPFLTQYDSLLATFRDRELNGAVLFVTSKPVGTVAQDDLHRKGAILVNMQHERPLFIKYLLVFVVELQEKLTAAREVAELSEYISVARALDQTHQEASRTKPEKGEVLPGEEGLAEILAEADEIPQQLSFAKLTRHPDFAGANFLFSFEVVHRKEKVPLSCMANFSKINPDRNWIYFKNFQPLFAHELLRNSALETTRHFLGKVMKDPEIGQKAENVLQITLEIAGANRSCNFLPFLDKDNEVAFLPVSDAFLQKRRYLRIMPSRENPVTAYVATETYCTQRIELIDISERGLSFWHPQPLRLTEEVLVYMKWDTIDVVCKGIVQFSAQVEKRNKIGVELFPHEMECVLIRQEIFRYQIETFKELREERP